MDVVVPPQMYQSTTETRANMSSQLVPTEGKNQTFMLRTSYDAIIMDVQWENFMYIHIHPHDMICCM